MFIAVTFIISKTWKQPKSPPTDECIKIWWCMCVPMLFVYICVYIYEYHWLLKNKEIMPFATTWMNLDIIKLSEVNQRQIPYDITYMWKQMIQINLFMKQK